MDYEQLRETLTIVTKERDLAVKEKNQLQAKLENLEQVLKVRSCLVNGLVLTNNEFEELLNEYELIAWPQHGLCHFAQM